MIERFTRPSDLSSTVLDVLDELGLVGVIAASTLRPTLPDDRAIGPTITVRNVEQRRSAFAAVTDHDWRMAEIAAIANGRPVTCC